MSPDELKKYTNIISYNFLSNSIIAIWLSHYKLWKYIVDNNLDNILIIEDDVELVDDCISIIENLVPNDYDMVSLGNLFTKKYEKGKNIELIKNGVLSGMHGYLLSNKGATYLIKELNKVKYHIDVYLSYFNKIHSKFNSYTTNYQLIYQTGKYDSDNHYKEHPILGKIVNSYDTKDKIDIDSALSTTVLYVRKLDMFIDGYFLIMVTLILLSKKYVLIKKIIDIMMIILVIELVMTNIDGGKNLLKQMIILQLVYYMMK